MAAATAWPTNYPNGISTDEPGEQLYLHALPDPTKWVTYFNDFFTYAAGDWVITTIEGGAGDATEALADGFGGWLLITNDAAAPDSDFFQLAKENFIWSPTKRLFFKARFKVNDATQSRIVMGLAVTDTTPEDAADAIFFIKADGATALELKAIKTAAGTTTLTGATMANDTFVEVGFVYLPQPMGGPVLQSWVNGAMVASTTVTTNIPTTELALTFGIGNGEAVAKTMTVDYLYVAAER